MWTFLGFPTYGNGPFERGGLPTSVALLVGFVAVCAAGLALPFGPLLGLARTVLVVAIPVSGD